MNPPDLRVTHVYVDETSQTKHRFLVLGCMIAWPEECVDIAQNIAVARLPELPAGELKWTKVSRRMLPAYKRVVDAYFKLSTPIYGPHFHSLVVDTSKLKDGVYNDGSRELGFNKEVYQLLMKLRRLYPNTLYHVYPDHRSTPTTPEELRLVLNRGAKKLGDARDWPFRRVHWRKSDEEICIQVVDLMIGAIAFRLNGHHLAKDASPAKIELSQHILQRAHIVDVTRDTTTRGHFTIWHRQLR